tara:strand:+ start:250 stop:399 length:150 start_codon:yes stop_codon:yes gene_type:complete
MYLQKTITRADGSQYISCFWTNPEQSIKITWSDEQEATSNWLDQHGTTE